MANDLEEEEGGGGLPSKLLQKPGQETAWKPRHELQAAIWAKYAKDPEAKLLQNLTIAHDGGLSTESLKQLMGPGMVGMKWFYAIQLLLFVCVNVLYIIKQDIGVLAYNHHQYTLEEDKRDPHQFLLTQGIVDHIINAIARLMGCESHHLNNSGPVVVVELGFLAVLLYTGLVRILKAMCTSEEHYRWDQISSFFWEFLPKLSTFSLMRVLYYVTPSVLGTELYLEISFVQERWGKGRPCRALWPLLMYIITRVLAFVVGFDAFLVKYRTAMVYANAPDATWGHVIGSLVFLFQVLGVVNLTWFVRRRLFIFIFGGEDGVVTNREKAVECYWNAMLAKRLWETYGFVDFLVVMLSFSDYDFQMLVLNDGSLNTTASAVASADGIWARHPDVLRRHATSVM